MKNKKLRTIVLTGVFAGIIAVVTCFIKIPMGNGYTHVGDAFIYLASCILPMPYAMIAASIGGMLADGMAGYAMWIIPTGIIKIFNVIPFSNKGDKILTTRNMIAPAVSSLATIFGYYIANVIMYKNFITPFSELPTQIIQVIMSAIVFFVVACIFDKSNLKHRLEKY